MGSTGTALTSDPITTGLILVRPVFDPRPGRGTRPESPGPAGRGKPLGLQGKRTSHARPFQGFAEKSALTCSKEQIPAFLAAGYMGKLSSHAQVHFSPLGWIGSGAWPAPLQAPDQATCFIDDFNKPA